MRDASAKLLLVEDSELLAAQLSRRLREWAGLELLGPALNADQALQLAREQRPQALLLGLPPVGGLDLLQQLCETVRPAPVLVLCASSAAALHARCMALGAHGVYTKPEGLSSCLLALRTLLGLRT